MSIVLLICAFVLLLLFVLTCTLLARSLFEPGPLANIAEGSNIKSPVMSPFIFAVKVMAPDPNALLVDCSKLAMFAIACASPVVADPPVVLPMTELLPVAVLEDMPLFMLRFVESVVLLVTVPFVAAVLFELGPLLAMVAAVGTVELLLTEEAEAGLVVAVAGTGQLVGRGGAAAGVT
jgi:hypothetical protein